MYECLNIFISTTVTTFTMHIQLASVGTSNSSLEGAMKLKFGSFCSF